MNPTYLVRGVANALTKLHDDPNDKVKVALDGAYAMLRQHYPEHLHPVEDSFLAYYSCAACGEYPPKLGGWDLYEHTRYPQLRYPLCGKCVGAEPKWERLALMYANYAMNCQTTTHSARIALAPERGRVFTLPEGFGKLEGVSNGL